MCVLAHTWGSVIWDITLAASVIFVIFTRLELLFYFSIKRVSVSTAKTLYTRGTWLLKTWYFTAAGFSAPQRGYVHQVTG